MHSYAALKRMKILFLRFRPKKSGSKAPTLLSSAVDDTRIGKNSQYYQDDVEEC